MPEGDEMTSMASRRQRAAWHTLVGCGAAVAFLCCVAVLGATLLGMRLWPRMMILHPTRIAQVSQQIARYRLPEGYKELFASDLLGFKMVAIGPTGAQAGLLTIVLLQLPPVEMDDAALRQQIEEAVAQQTGLGNVVLRPAGRQKVTIRGQTVELTLQRGTTPDGQVVQQLSGMFDGTNGPVLLFISGLERAWDAPRIAAFLASIE
ncbi:MAG: hypothetical protein DDG58_14130 [Ardenticatenia bacterium]|jgi:hypothetical protein|nr:MAG: hypothetical protein DDG58_14130 [Ardenticatenia bacterium]